MPRINTMLCRILSVVSFGYLEYSFSTENIIHVEDIK